MPWSPGSDWGALPDNWDKENVKLFRTRSQHEFHFPDRRVRDKEERLYMLDAVAGMHTDASQSLLTDLILLSPKPNKELVERLLIASAGFVHTVSEVMHDIHI